MEARILAEDSMEHRVYHLLVSKTALAMTALDMASTEETVTMQSYCKALFELYLQREDIEVVDELTPEDMEEWGEAEAEEDEVEQDVLAGETTEDQAGDRSEVQVDERSAAAGTTAKEGTKQKGDTGSQAATGRSTRAEVGAEPGGKGEKGESVSAPKPRPVVEAASAAPYVMARCKRARDRIVFARLVMQSEFHADAVKAAYESLAHAICALGPEALAPGDHAAIVAHLYRELLPKGKVAVLAATVFSRLRDISQLEAQGVEIVPELAESCVNDASEWVTSLVG